MSITEQEYAEAFGVELPQGEEDTASEQETAEDIAADTGGEEAQECEDTESGRPEDARSLSDGVQSIEERRRQAYGRRQREREAERQAMTAAAQARVDAVYADLFSGQENPFTHRPIRSEADFRAYRQALEKQERMQQMQAAGVDPAALQGMVDEAVRPLREQMQRQTMETMSAEARSVTAKAQEAIRRGVESIRVKYGENVQSVEDILAMPTGGAFNEYVQKGLPLEDAFYLANRETLDRRRMEAARQAGIKQASGKRHMSPVPSAGGDAPYTATAAQKAMFRQINPNATDDEINAAYGEFYKQ